MPDIATVNAVLAPYLALGIVPMVIPPVIPVVQSLSSGWPAQVNMTDRAFVQQMAAQCGYVFFVRPGPAPLSSIAYFGPDTALPIPQPALSINLDAQSNVDSLSFTLDGLAKKARIYTILDPITKKIPIPIPVPNINIFKPPLGARPTPLVPAKIDFASDFAKYPPDEAANRVLAYLLDMDNAAAIRGSGSLDAFRYGRVLQDRALVGVRGAGLAYDGMYFVDSVSHAIKKGSYSQNFTLSRDGLISNTPRVPV
jgi:hypothetical protein